MADKTAGVPFKVVDMGLLFSMSVDHYTEKLSTQQSRDRLSALKK